MEHIIGIKKAFDRIYPISAFCSDDLPMRDTIIDLCYDVKISWDECGNFLKSLLDEDAKIAYGII